MYAVVMAGGSGTRFWPLSRIEKPKQFLDITGKGPMVLETCNRLRSVSADDEIIVVLGKSHLEEAENIFRGRNIHLLAEPLGRNTAPCIGLGALYARYLGCKGAVAFLPADHFIGNPVSFVKSLESAAALALSGGIVTLGIVPGRPETGYGYIRRGGRHINPEGVGAYNALEFVEKPDLEKALYYLASGEYYWNAGIFVATPETVLNEIEVHMPELYAGLQRLTQVMGLQNFETELKKLYESIEGVSFDYGIMEKTDERIYVLPCECGWSDIGSWESLYELKTADHDSFENLAEGDAFLLECKKSYVSARGGRCVTCLGLDNCLVVDTNDALLVADLRRSQDIRRIVDHLRRNYRERLL